MQPRTDDPWLIDVSAEPADEAESLTVRYDFGSAASPSDLTVRQLTRSLQGWDDLFYILQQVLGHGVVPTKGEHARRPSSFRVREIRRDCIIVHLAWIPTYNQVAMAIALLSPVYGPYLHKGAEHCRRKLWEQIKNLIEVYLDARRRRKDGIREILQQLDQLVRESSMSLLDERSLADTIAQLHDDLISATEPLDDEIESITVERNKDCEPIRIERGDRSALHRALDTSGLEIPAPEAQEILVRFTRLNRKTGKGLVVVGEQPLRDSNQEWCEITDPAVHEANDPYTTAFAGDRAIWVHARYLRPVGLTMNPQWVILAPSNREAAELFGSRPTG